MREMLCEISRLLSFLCLEVLAEVSCRAQQVRQYGETGECEQRLEVSVKGQMKIKLRLEASLEGQEALKALQEAPKTLQELPKTLQEESKKLEVGLQRRPRGVQELQNSSPSAIRQQTAPPCKNHGFPKEN